MWFMKFSPHTISRIVAENEEANNNPTFALRSGML